jgi:acetolactate synthase-1/2/3 large subunit
VASEAASNGLDAASAAALIARFLKAQGVSRVFTLCGGHIMPMFMQAQAAGLRIVDVRDERAAVYMAHAHAELTGELGVALVTAGPGVTNAMTGIANAHIARAPVLVLSGTPPRGQDNRGALQDLPHTEFVRPITRYARTVRDPALVLQELGEAVARALGQGGDPGPVYLDFPTDVRRCPWPHNWLNTLWHASGRCCSRARRRPRKRWNCCGRHAGRW